MNEIISDKSKSVPELNTNSTDKLVSSLKVLLGAVPVAGPLLAEIVTQIIPNQRIDRMNQYMELLSLRLDQLNISHEVLKSKIAAIDLIEDSFYQAARASTKSRLKYIANLLANGLSNESITCEESRFVLKILEELSDLELIWLRFYQDEVMDSDHEFREKHSNVLKPVVTHLSSAEETIEKAAIQEGYKERLARMNLIRIRYKVDQKTGTTVIDPYSGAPKIQTRSLSPLGRLVLKMIEFDLVDREN
ncbi:MAG: hypothetical protein H3C47_00665 [Candidatus Cloacimonetes bacterium]|nr:hypothetical protein [Candidatus Cloacimonadota bacterium]